MGWKARLQQLLLAGGSLAMTGCFGGRCNANSDPCCPDPHGQLCLEKTQCDNQGESYRQVYEDGGSHIECVGLDAGVPDLAEPSDDGAAHD